MNKELIKATLTFLNRVQLQGSEVNVFNEVMAGLQAELKEDKKSPPVKKD